MSTKAARRREWQRPQFYGAMFWIWIAVISFVDRHVTAAHSHARDFLAIWQLGFMLVAAGYLICAAPPEKREDFSKFGAVNGPLIFFFGPLTIPGYLWYWYGWKRALQFLAITLLYFVAFVLAVIVTNMASPGTF